MLLSYVSTYTHTVGTDRLSKHKHTKAHTSSLLCLCTSLFKVNQDWKQ